MIKCAGCSKLLPTTSYRKLKAETLGYVDFCRNCVENHEAKKMRADKKKACTALVDKAREAGNTYRCNKCEKVDSIDEFYYKLNGIYLYINEVECRQCTKDRMRFNSFGITPEGYKDLLKAQDNKCAICLIDLDEYVKTSRNSQVFSIDHCHKTGAIRGLLCSKCNRGIGYLQDSVENLRRAAKYLQG